VESSRVLQRLFPSPVTHMSDECKHCGWNFPEPGLAEAVFGSQECLNCGQTRSIDKDDRIEAIHSYEQKLHICEQKIARLTGQSN